MNSSLLNNTYFDLNQMFNEVLNIPRINIDEKLPTFLELSGYPNWENVISNIYQFFLTDKFHGFGRLFISALDDCIPEKDITMNDYLVVREDRTKEGGRIDILIKEIDIDQNITKAVLIENKIYHSLENDLTDYFDTFSEVSDRTLILLTLTEHHIDPPFVNITHKQWIERIQFRLGNHFISNDLKYLVLLQDFINHMLNFYKKTIEMDALKFLYENGKKINQIKSLEQEGLNYISDEIGKVLAQTKWNWGRTIPSGLQIQREIKPLIGYFYFNKIFVNKTITMQLWLKGEKYVNLRKDKNIPDHIKSIAEAHEIKMNVSHNTKEWYNVAEKVYQISSIDQLEKIGDMVSDLLQNDWEEFVIKIEQEYTD